MKLPNEWNRGLHDLECVWYYVMSFSCTTTLSCPWLIKKMIPEMPNGMKLNINNLKGRCSLGHFIWPLTTSWFNLPCMKASNHHVPLVWHRHMLQLQTFVCSHHYPSAQSYWLHFFLNGIWIIFRTSWNRNFDYKTLNQFGTWQIHNHVEVNGRWALLFSNIWFFLVAIWWHPSSHCKAFYNPFPMLW